MYRAAESPAAASLSKTECQYYALPSPRTRFPLERRCLAVNLVLERRIFLANKTLS